MGFEPERDCRLSRCRVVVRVLPGGGVSRGPGPTEMCARYLRARGVQVPFVVSLSRVPRSFRGRRGGPVSESLGFLRFWCIL